MKCFACSELTNFLPICIHPTQASLAQNFLTPVHVRAMGIFGIYLLYWNHYYIYRFANQKYAFT